MTSACYIDRWHKAIVVGILVAAMILAGCGLTQSKQDAEKVLARHFQAIATNGHQAALTDYGSQFFNRTPQEEWSKALATLNGKLGQYQMHSVQRWHIFKGAGAAGAGTTVSLQCQVTYAKHPATETFTLFKGLSDSEYKIVGHQINSDGLLKE